MSDQPANDNYDLADDTLCGAQEIADFMFKAQRASGKASRRAIYHLVSTSRLPTFRRGGKICARKSVLLQWIKQQEECSVSESRRHA